MAAAMVHVEHLIRKVLEPSGARDKLLEALVSTRREATKGGVLRAQMDQLVEENEQLWLGLRAAVEAVDKFAVGDHSKLVLRLRRLLAGIPSEGEEPEPT